MIVHFAYSAYIGSQNPILVIIRPSRPLLLRLGFQEMYSKSHNTSNPEYNAEWQARMLPSLSCVDSLAAAVTTYWCTSKIYPQAPCSQIFINTEKLNRIHSEPCEEE